MSMRLQAQGCPAEPQAPLQLTEQQIKFLLLAIRDLDRDAADVETEIRKRILVNQSRAYQIYPYPCIRIFQHVSLFMAENEVFDYILKAGQNAVQAAPLLLDIGCCMGTDLRHLVQSGYPSTSVIGCDIQPGFIDMGYELYADRDTCPIPFFVADVFNLPVLSFPQAAQDTHLSLRDVQSFDVLRGRVKYVYTGALFHIFDEETQEALARRLATLLDVTEGNGPAMIFGRHAAKAKEGIMYDELMNTTLYTHSPTSWKALWERVLGGKLPVRVDASFHWRAQIRDTDMMFWSVWVG